MTSAVRSLTRLVVVVLMVCLVASVSFAKDKKGKGVYTPPTVTAEQAMAVVKDALPRLTAGSAIVKTGKRGDKKMEVPLLLDGNIVSKMRINPLTGEIMPKGVKTEATSVSASPEQAVNIVRQALPNLEVTTVSLDKQGNWKVDLALKKALVAHIKVNGTNSTIMPDAKATRDATQPKR